MDIDQRQIGSSENLSARDKAIGEKEEMSAALGALTAITPTTTPSVAPNTETCYFMQTIPIEIRNNIYKQLLLSDDLSTQKSVNSDNSISRSLGLHVSILGTCSKIYEEASLVLYGLNTFYFYNSVPYTSRMFCSFPAPDPPTETQEFYDERIINYDKFESLFQSETLFQKIRRWKIVLSSCNYDDYVEHRQLYVDGCLPLLCRAISGSNIKSMTVCIASRSKKCSSSGADPRIPLSLIVARLKILRNIENFELKIAEKMDLPRGHWCRRHRKRGGNAATLDLTKLRYLKGVLEGSSPVERVDKMFSGLVTYAQAFERNGAFKEEMNPGYGEAICRRRCRAWRDAQRTLFDPEDDLYSEDWASSADGFNDKLESLFLNDGPILSKAPSNLQVLPVSKIMLSRAVVLEYIEPQYQRMMLAYDSLVQFVAEQKNLKGMLFDHVQSDLYHGTWYLAEGVILLTELAKSLCREVPQNLKWRFIVGSETLKDIYDDYSRELMLRDLYRKVKGGKLTFSKVELFQEAVEEMEGQYQEIREARKALFEHDLHEPDCEIDPEISRSDAKIGVSKVPLLSVHA